MMIIETDQKRPVTAKHVARLNAQAHREKIVAAIREGLADAEAGRVKPARKALKTLAKKYGLTDE